MSASSACATAWSNAKQRIYMQANDPLKTFGVRCLRGRSPRPPADEAGPAPQTARAALSSAGDAAGETGRSGDPRRNCGADSGPARSWNLITALTKRSAKFVKCSADSVRESSLRGDRCSSRLPVPRRRRRDRHSPIGQREPAPDALASPRDAPPADLTDAGASPKRGGPSLCLEAFRLRFSPGDCGVLVLGSPTPGTNPHP